MSWFLTTVMFPQYFSHRNFPSLMAMPIGKKTSTCFAGLQISEFSMFSCHELVDCIHESRFASMKPLESCFMILKCLLYPHVLTNFKSYPHVVYLSISSAVKFLSNTLRSANVAILLEQRGGFPEQPFISRFCKRVLLMPLSNVI